ncbi:transposase [Microbispora oryzae]
MSVRAFSWARIVGDNRRRFDPEFREGAVRIVKETGKPVAQVARELGINPYTLHNWVKLDREREGESGTVGASERQELARLRAAEGGLGEGHSGLSPAVVRRQAAVTRGAGDGA